MDKILIMLVIILFVFTLTACMKYQTLTTKQEEETTVDYTNEQTTIDHTNEETTLDNIEKTCEEDLNQEKCNKKIINEDAKKLEYLTSNSFTIYGDNLYESLYIKENIKIVDGNIILDDNADTGEFETAEIKTIDFISMVPSWNIEVSKNAFVDIYVSVKIDEEWSTYYHVAYWKNFHNQYTNPNDLSDNVKEDLISKLSIDTISILNNKVAQAIKFKIRLNKDTEENTSPIIKNISVTVKPTEFNEIPIVHKDDYLKIIDVPQTNQLSVSTIGNVICSPTSVQMVMAHNDIVIKPYVLALAVKDNGAGIYGNWSFSASYPGSAYDFNSRVEYLVDEAYLKEYIKNDQPVIMSIKTKVKNELPGSQMAYPNGHLLVLVGFEEVDGVLYAIVNDPANYKDEDVRKSYEYEKLLAAWRNYVYIIDDKRFVE